jgi:hypothetical protein
MHLSLAHFPEISSVILPLLFLALLLLFSVYLLVDYTGPRSIRLSPDHVFGFPCLRAKDLIVQEYDRQGNLFATRGMLVYILYKGSHRFTRVIRIPTGLTIYWLRNFSLVRKLTIRPECVEMITTPRGDLFALSAGRIWHLPAGTRKFRESLKLTYYGLGDQGARNVGLLSSEDDTVFFGEYFRNTERTVAKVFATKDRGVSWQPVLEFPPRRVRHIHALQRDPYTGKLWICTGDLDEECLLAWSEDEYKTIIPLGEGSQLWRICQVVFTEDAIYWGTDTSAIPEAGIYRWNRQNGELRKLVSVDGAVFFGIRLSGGTIVFSTDREGMANEKDKKTRLWIITPEGKIGSVECGTWKHYKPGFWFKFAFLRFQRDQDGESLAISCMNQLEIPDGELILISEADLLARMESLPDAADLS